MGLISKLFGRGTKLDEKTKARIAASPNGEAMLAHLKKNPDHIPWAKDIIASLEHGEAMAAKGEPIFTFACAILDISGHCTRKLDSTIKFPTEEEKRHYAIFVSFAFAVFFCHMALRAAFRSFGPKGRDKVLDGLGPLLIGATARCWTGSEEGLAEWRSRLFEVAQGLEIEYSECAEFMTDPSHGNGWTDNSVIAAFTRNVLELSGYEVPQIEGPKKSWPSLADFVGAGGKILCRYSSDPQVVNPLTILRVQRLAIEGLDVISLPDHITKIMNQ